MTERVFRVCSCCMILLENKRVRFDYEILDTFEAGLVLEGWEVKSLRAKNANLKSSWVRFHGDEAWLENCDISAWRYSSEIQPKDRPKKLLLNKKELVKIENKLNEKGVTLAPTKIFTLGPNIKCEIAIVRGRKKHEKRQVLKERAMDKTARQTVKNFNN